MCDDERCEWCGEPGTDAEPLAECVTSPPVDGYPVETAMMHAMCARAAARAMVE